MALINALGAIALEATQTLVKNATESLVSLATTGVRAQRRDADTPPVADGQSHVLNTNAIGRLKTSVLPGAIDATTGTITANAQTVAADVSRASNVMIAVTGTFTGVNLSFELSIDGGTTWFATQALRTNANIVEVTTGVIATSVAYAWELSVNGCTNVRVRATAFTSGTVNVRILPGSFATEPIPAIQTHPVTVTSGTITANTFAQAPVAAAGVLLSYLNANNIGLAVVKATSGRLLGYRIFNPNTSPAYVQVFNAATTGAVTLGTTVPLEVYPIPAGATLDGQVDFSYSYTAGIVIAATTTPTGNTAVTTGLMTSLRYI